MFVPPPRCLFSTASERLLIVHRSVSFGRPIERHFLPYTHLLCRQWCSSSANNNASALAYGDPHRPVTWVCTRHILNILCSNKSSFCFRDRDAYCRKGSTFVTVRDLSIADHSQYMHIVWIPFVFCNIFFRCKSRPWCCSLECSFALSLHQVKRSWARHAALQVRRPHPEVKMHPYGITRRRTAETAGIRRAACVLCESKLGASPRARPVWDVCLASSLFWDNDEAPYSSWGMLLTMVTSYSD